jgi:DNA polymerase-3 subunit alpha
MSHELRTPLNGVIGYAEMIKEGVMGPVQPPIYSNYIENIHSSGKHMLTLIEEVLSLSETEFGTIQIDDQTVNLDEVMPGELQEFESLCERSPGNCKLYFDVDVPELRGQERLRSRSYVIEPTQEFMKGAQRIFGADNIALKGN